MTRKMKTSSRTKWILLAAIAAVPVAGVTAPAGAQYQRVDRGDALDSNRRIGDDRRNSVSSSYRVDNTRIEAVRQPTGNQIVTGNVTGNRHFRGDPGYRSDREFRANTASDVSDSFIRSSAGTAGASNRVTNYNVAVPFYPAGRTVDPPPGFVQQNLAGGGYVPPSALDNRIDRGAVTPRGGSLILGSPAQPQDPLDTRSVITASPLLGVQQLPYDYQQTAYGQPMLGQRSSVLDEATILRMREELRTGTMSPQSRTGNPPAGAPQSGSQLPGVGGTDGSESAAGQVQPLGQQTVGNRLQNLTGDAAGLEQDQEQQPGGPLGAQPLSGGTVGNITGQATRRRPLPTPGEQTPAYAELQRRLQQFANDPNLTDEEAFRAAQRARQEADAAQRSATAAEPTPPAAPGAAPGQPQQAQDPDAPESRAERLGLTDFTKQNEELFKGGAPDERAAPASPPQSPRGEPPAPRAVLTPPQAQQQKTEAPAAPPARGAKPSPVKITSLAAGVPGKGLADLLTSAESLMKEGRFSSALEKYDAAEQVAPNNPLIKLGRANAELGASYFARAEQHLREAFAADEALLMGQYDLRAFFGEDRLKVIANDLKEIANKEPSQVTPVFLLAYVAYNSENEHMATGYLDLAEKRSGGKDPLIQKIRQYWVLPGTEEAAPAAPAEEPAEANK
ncbi:MAG TPA: hypothetical protein VGR35_05225 [Tepidisphaeraceae bacterium]|nr:hypothetical protein [Tepidisphaeraceae bacterium]